MALFTVVVEETVLTAYTVEADSAEQARETWDRETDECGPIDWSVGKSSRVLSSLPADEESGPTGTQEG